MKEINYFAGIDVQVRRGCTFYVLDSSSKYVTSGWIEPTELHQFSKIFSQLVNGNLSKIAIGVDAPRMPLDKLRNRYYNKETRKWNIKKKESIGRECEVIINSNKIATCQWTNTLENSPNWMRLGFNIFKELKKFKYLHEVFPSASYKMLENENLMYELCIKNFKRGTKDMLDASVAAVTVKEFLRENGCEVGGEDGLGTIVLPRKIINS